MTAVDPMTEDVDASTKRRVILVELTLPARSWSSSELQDALNVAVPILEPVVYGELDTGVMDACRHKINQITREVESAGKIENDPGMLHTCYKAGSFFRDIFPHRFFDRDKS